MPADTYGFSLNTYALTACRSVVVQRPRRFERRARLPWPALEKVRPTGGHIALHLQRVVADGFAVVQNLLCESHCRRVSGADDVDRPQSVQDRCKLRDATNRHRFAQRAAQLASAQVARFGLRRGVTTRRHQCWTERHTQLELAFVTLDAFGQACQHLEPFGDMRDRFQVRRVVHRPITGLEPPRDRIVEQSGLCEMARNHFGLGQGAARELSDHHARDDRVVALARAAQQRLVRRVANQRVLEAVRRAARMGLRQHESGGDHARELVLDECFVLLTEATLHLQQQVIFELSTDRRAELGHAFGRTESIQACHQRVGESCRNGHRTQLGDQSGQLFEIERHAVGFAEHTRHLRTTQRAPGGVLDDRR